MQLLVGGRFVQLSSVPAAVPARARREAEAAGLCKPLSAAAAAALGLALDEDDATVRAGETSEEHEELMALMRAWEAEADREHPNRVVIPISRLAATSSGGGEAGVNTVAGPGRS